MQEVPAQKDFVIVNRLALCQMCQGGVIGRLRSAASLRGVSFFSILFLFSPVSTNALQLNFCFHLELFFSRVSDLHTFAEVGSSL